MKEKTFARIQYRVTELKLKQPHTPGTPFGFEAKGELAIAVSPIKVEFSRHHRPRRHEHDQDQRRGQFENDVVWRHAPRPDFGMGLMKCADDIRIIFDWLLAVKQP